MSCTWLQVWQAKLRNVPAPGRSCFVLVSMCGRGERFSNLGQNCTVCIFSTRGWILFNWCRWIWSFLLSRFGLWVPLCVITFKPKGVGHLWWNDKRTSSWKTAKLWAEKWSVWSAAIRSTEEWEPNHLPATKIDVEKVTADRPRLFDQFQASFFRFVLLSGWIKLWLIIIAVIDSQLCVP